MRVLVGDQPVSVNLVAAHSAFAKDQMSKTSLMGDITQGCLDVLVAHVWQEVHDSF